MTLYRSLIIFDLRWNWIQNWDNNNGWACIYSSKSGPTEILNERVNECFVLLFTPIDFKGERLMDLITPSPFKHLPGTSSRDKGQMVHTYKRIIKGLRCMTVKG